jgi:phosphate butyryltransferase
MRRLADIIAAVKAAGTKPRVVIAPCAEQFVLRAAADAAREGLAEPIFIGRLDRAEPMARALGLTLCEFRCDNCEDDAEAVARAVRMYATGEAELIMKGLVSTSTLLKAILDKQAGLVPPGGILSLVTAFEAPGRAPGDERLILLTDAGVNIRPTLQRKADILKNALSVARALGMASPRAAMLAATEKVNYPAMPATLDADIIAKMAEGGEFGDARVAGPLALDLAVSPAAAAMKGVAGPVAGHADILCAPDIESGNILYKALSSLMNLTLASVVVGSRVPVVVPSRGDSEHTKLASLALAAYLSQQNGDAA